jgi:hypothetical protein
MASKNVLSLLFAAIPVLAGCAQQCPIQFDGRIPANTTLTTFDTSASLFNPSFVFGQSRSFPWLDERFDVADIERSDLVQNPATSVIEPVSRPWPLCSLKVSLY